MSILSFNVRGCGNPLKRKRIYKILRKGKSYLCFLQERKLKKMDSVLA